MSGKPEVPFEFRIWDASECAEYFGVSQSEFLSTYLGFEDFPKDLPNSPGRWRALSVTDWMLKRPQQESPERPAKPRPTPCCALYRHFAADGDLLYIGISIWLPARTYQHARDSHWFRLVSRIEIQHFETVSEAAAAERQAIKVERPKFNILHNGDEPC